MTVKTFYIYDEHTREYLYPYQAQESPLEPGKFIRPTNSSEKPAPVPETNEETAQFDILADDWIVSLDFRNRIFFDQTSGEPVTYDVLGQIPEHLSASPKPKSPQQIQAERKAEIFQRLIEIDLLSMRPLRAVYAGTDTTDDHEKLASLENETLLLRAELAEMV